MGLFGRRRLRLKRRKIAEEAEKAKGAKEQKRLRLMQRRRKMLDEYFLLTPGLRSIQVERSEIPPKCKAFVAGGRARKGEGA